MSFLDEAMTKVKAWSDAACSLGTSSTLTIREDGKEAKYSLHDLWCNLEQNVKMAKETPETAFLGLSAIDAYLERLPWLYPVTLHQLAANEDEIKETMTGIEKLRTEIQSNPAYEVWQDIQRRIQTFATENGLPAPDITGLSEITPILLDAMRVTTKWPRQQWRAGVDCLDRPLTYWSMPRFRHISDFVDSLAFGRACCIAFGLIEPLVEDYADPLLAQYGKRPELLNNSERHYGTDGLKKVHGGYAVVGIKRGDNIWVLRQPLSWDENPYGSTNFEHYGKRVSYLPYQVTFRDSSMTPGLVVRDKPAWDLRSVLDAEQVVWLPIMVAAVTDAFFSGPLPSSPSLWVNSRCVNIINSATPQSFELATVTYTLIRPSVFSQRNITGGVLLLNYLGITEETFNQIPVAFPVIQNMTAADYEQELKSRMLHAAGFEASKRLLELFSRSEFPYTHEYLSNAYISGPREITTLYKNAVSANMDAILRMLNDPKSEIHAMVTVTVNGFCGKDHYGRTVVHKTSLEQGRPLQYEYLNPRVWQFFPQAISGKRPPVALLISPMNAHQLALLMGTSREQLDMRIRFWKCKHIDAGDPLLNCIENPYDKLCFQVKMAFNKRDFHSMIPTMAAKYENSREAKNK